MSKNKRIFSTKQQVLYNSTIHIRIFRDNICNGILKLRINVTELLSYRIFLSKKFVFKNFIYELLCHHIP